jgi:hypothetical protein
MLVAVAVLGAFAAWIGNNLAWIRQRREANRQLVLIAAPHNWTRGREFGPFVRAPWPLPYLGDSSERFRDWYVPLDEADEKLLRFRKLFPELSIHSVPLPAIESAETPDAEDTTGADQI